MKIISDNVWLEIGDVNKFIDGLMLCNSSIITKVISIKKINEIRYKIFLPKLCTM